MLGLRVLSPLPFFPSTFPNSPPTTLAISCSFLSTFHKPNKNPSLLFSISPPGKTRTPVHASRDKEGKTTISTEEEQEEEEGENEEDGEEELLPFDEMKRWFRNKPSGFGEGKVYDTSLEEKLLEELEQSRNAQLANINNLKHNPTETSSKMQKQKKAPEVVPGTVQVRVGNLPKKKNIHRDLQSAFKEFPGLLHISPAVSGNRKTRDPICKGFALLDFKSEEAANRFVQMYSGQNLPFGKIQKQISCELASSCHSPSSGSGQPTVNTIISTPPVSFSTLQEEVAEDDSMGNLFPDGREFGDQSRFLNTKEIKGQVGFGCEIAPEIDDEASLKTSDEERVDQAGSLTSGQERTMAKKKKVAKTKANRDLQLSKLQSSANRLKIRERAVLTGVLSKYGGKTAAARTP